MRIRSLVVAFIILFAITSASAVTRTSATSGAWATPATWGGTVPLPGDDVIITSNHVVTIGTAQSCLSLTLNSTGTLAFSANVILGISGDVTIAGSLNQIIGSNALQIINVGGTFNVTSAGVGGVTGITLTVTGTTNISGYLAFALNASGTKTFNNTITVFPGGTWDNIIGEDFVVNCSIVNRGSWPAPTGGGGVYTVTANGTSYVYTGPKVINMNELRLTSGTGTSIVNYGFLALNGTAANVLNVGAGRSFTNGDGTGGVLYMAGSGGITNSGTVDLSKPLNVVEYNFAGNQPVFATTYYNLVTSISGVKALSGNAIVQNSVTTANSSIFDTNTNTLNGAANLIMTETSSIVFRKNATTLPELTGTANSFAAGTTVVFNGAGTQTAKPSSATNPSTTNAYPYQNINLSGTNVSSLVNMSGVTLIRGNFTLLNLGKMTSNPVMTIGGTFSFSPATTQLISNDITMGSFLISNGTLNYSNRVLTVNGLDGTWTNNGGGTFINTNSNVIFTTGTNQQITGTASTSFANLQINNLNNVTLVGVDVSVTSGLNLTAGRLITGVNAVYVPTGGSVSRVAGYVDGNLAKDIFTGIPITTFEIGSGTKYTPIDLTFNAVSGAGIITVFSNNGDHPGIAASNIEPIKTANRFWSIKNNGATFTSFDAVFTFDATDLDGTATPANFQVKATQNGGVTWINTTIGTRTATSTQIVGQPSGTLPTSNVQVDFQLGELIANSGLFNRLTGPSLSWNDKATWIEYRSGSISFTTGSTAVTGLGTSFLTELSDGDILMMQTTAGIVQGTVAAGGRISNTSLTLISGSPSTVTGSYGRQRIPNLSGDVVTIGNANADVADALTNVNYDMPAATTINTLNINTLSAPRTTPQSLTHTVTNLLTVQTNVVINQPGASGIDAWNIDAGTVFAPGTVTIGSLFNDITRIASVNVTTGTLSLGSILFHTTNNTNDEATAVINVTGAGRINMSGSLNFTNNRGSLNPGTASSFNFNGTAAQLLIFPSIIPTIVPVAFKFNNLIFNNSSTSGVTISPTGQDITPLNVTGDIIVQSGIFVIDDDTDITGNPGKTFQIDAGATFRMTGNNSTFPTSFGTFSLGTVSPFGTVRYEQTSPTNIETVAFGNLQLLYSGTTYSLPAIGASVAGTLKVGDGTSSPTVVGLATTSFTVTRDVIINKNATINANSGSRLQSFTVGGNWTNDGSFIPSSDPTDAGVVFNGAALSSPQIISGTATQSFSRVTVNSPATALVQLSKPVTITTLLTLSAGGIDLNGNRLNVTNPLNTAIGRTAGYIKSEKTIAPYGDLNWTISNTNAVFTYPFGKSSTEYIPALVNPTTVANVGATLSIATYATPPNNTPFPGTVTNLNGTSGGNSVVDRFWLLTSNATTRPIITLTLTALNTELPPTSPASITGQSWSNSNYWNAPVAGQTYTPGAPTFTTAIPLQLIPAGQTPYALTDIAIPLPIKLVEFTAVSRPGFVELNWKTETEIMNDFFTVQRSDGIEGFEDVVKVKGAGNSSSIKSYSAFDYHATAGKWYYRLKQTDFDGNFSYSKIVSAEVPQGLRGVYPNPASGSEFNFNFFQNDIGKDVFIKVQDMSGRELSQFVVEDLQSTKVKLEFSQKLSSGIYIVSIISEANVVRQKVVVK